jgi:threonine dehydrogenase-like Zn-dependent dehydrogenase
MKAMVLNAPGDVAISDIATPVIREGDVLVKVSFVGFCGGDLNGFRGSFPLQTYPVVLGHEVGGVIEATGAAVPKNILPGQRVTLNPYQSCGVCSPCRSGRPNACVDNRTMGVRRPGAMTSSIAVPWQALYSSEILTPLQLALVEPLAVGFHAVSRGRVSGNDTLVVIGCGVVGLGAVFSSVLRGARVVAVDLDQKKLEIAKAIGAQVTVNAATEDLHSILSTMTDGAGCDVIIEAVGSPSTIQSAIEEVAFGGRVVCIGYTKLPVACNAQLIVQKELDIYGSRNSLGEFGDVISALERGSFPLDLVISRIVPLEEAPAALAEWNEQPHRYTKIMVDLRDEVRL